MNRKYWKDTPSQKMRVKVDIDGVLRNTFSAMIDLYNNEFGESLKVTDIISYDSDVSFPLIREKLGKPGNTWFFKEHPRECFLAPAFPGVSEALSNLRSKGWEIVICTNQPTEAGRRYTLQFLEDNKIPYDELHFTKSKHLVAGDYLIDDAPEFLTAPSQELESRICIDYPFNQGIPSDFRVKSLIEAVKILSETTGETLRYDENKNEI
jgi:5'(3')-deoxyribonucleotidase